MRRCFVIAFALLVTSIGLEAKGTTVKLTLTGPGLAAPVEIVEPSILNQSNVWGGSFIGETLDAEPPVKQPIYTVSFDVLPPERLHEPARTMYTVSLARDARSGALLLYLPGRGEPGYWLNVRSMLRDGQDGYWHRPPAAWASAVAKYLP
ncbi:MAG TPA: hypothetical protein VGQ37_03705 [Vicinamibacterales bacterium]|jgi:hypothetical protein|nr:hypothetical protein [Vicinamibacterales bacterium]